ncbi:hypothetical protein KP509_37G042300 [Ceratopteris richardii]|nr:hypothetical protein KP509_37G042300 [Ceratopteris richardii]
MIKSLLLCNCGWKRTLMMARALCELQAELKGSPSGLSDKKLGRMEGPRTPEGRDVKRKACPKKGRYSKTRRFLELNETVEHVNMAAICLGTQEEKLCKPKQVAHIEMAGRDLENGVSLRDLDSKEKAYVPSKGEALHGRRNDLPGFVSGCGSVIGDFPTPEELCCFDAKFLAKRCGLGYRAESVSKLAKSICDGTVDLQLLEHAEREPSLRSDVRSRLLQIHGFGPFTSANILMCMGDYSIIPADTETIRHLRQVHGRLKCTAATVADEAATLYAPYEPYQFLSYWFELWGSYEQRFGKLSCMDPQFYNVFTGRNMSREPQGP